MNETGKKVSEEGRLSPSGSVKRTTAQGPQPESNNEPPTFGAEPQPLGPSESIKAAAKIIRGFKRGKPVEGGGGGGGGRGGAGGGDEEVGDEEVGDEEGGDKEGMAERGGDKEGMAERGGGAPAQPVLSAPVPLQNFWKLLWHCDVHKDHPNDYSAAAVNGLLPNSTISGVPAPAGHNISKDILFRINCPIQSTGIIQDYKTIGFGGIARIVNCCVPNTQYTVSSFRVNTTAEGDCKRLENELKGFLGQGPFLKYIDTTRHGGELLTHWDNRGPTKMLHAHTALIEMDPAYKINPLTNREPNFRQKFYYENIPSIIEYPAFTEAISNNPLTYTYCNKLFCVHNNGIVQSEGDRKRLNTKFVYFYTQSMPIELTGKAEGNDNTAGNLCKFLSKVSTALGFRRTTPIDIANTEAFFVSKHHGDVGQVLEQYRDSKLVRFDGENLINSNEYFFIFESIDMNAITKAFSIGVDCIFMHIQDTLVVFKNTKLDTPAVREASLAAEAQSEIQSFLEYTHIYNRNVDTINSKVEFYNGYKEALLRNTLTHVEERLDAVIAAAAAGANPTSKSQIINIQKQLSDAIYAAKVIATDTNSLKGSKRGFADAYACKQIANPNERYKFFLRKILNVCVLGEYIPKVRLERITTTVDYLRRLPAQEAINTCKTEKSVIPSHYMGLNILNATGDNLTDIKIPKTVIFEGAVPADGEVLVNCSAKLEYQWDMINVSQINQAQFKPRRNSVTPCYHKEWATDILIHLHRNLPNNFREIYDCLFGLLAVSIPSQTFFGQIIDVLGITPPAAAGGGGAGGGGGGGGGGGMAERKQSGGSIFSKTYKKKSKRKNKTIKLRVQYGGNLHNLNGIIDGLYADERPLPPLVSIAELRSTMLLQARMYLEMITFVASASGNIANQKSAISEFMNIVYGMNLIDEAVVQDVEGEGEERTAFMIDIGNTPDTIYKLIHNSPANDETEKIKVLLRILNGNMDDIFKEGYYRGSQDIASQIYELSKSVAGEREPASDDEGMALAAAGAAAAAEREASFGSDTQRTASLPPTGGFASPASYAGTSQTRVTPPRLIGLGAFKNRISQIYTTLTKPAASERSTSGLSFTGSF